MKIYHNNFFKTPFVLLLAISLTAVFIIPRQTKAFWGIGDVTFTTRIGTLPSDEKWIQDYILKPAVRILVRIMLQETTNMIVGWIQGNNGKNVGYVKNPAQFFRNVANKSGGEFLNQLTGINLCGNIGAFLQISLRTPPGLQQKLACSLTNIVQNVNSFYRNFNNGGWPAFISASVEPQNNPYGAYLIALDAKITAEGGAVDIARLKYQKSPFLGFQVAKPINCRTRIIGSEGSPSGGAVPLGEAEATRDREFNEPEALGIEAGLGTTPNSEEVCDTEYETKTPGQTIEYLLNKATGSGIDFAISAKDLDEAVATIINALINKVISSSVLAGNGRSGGEGVFNPDASRIQLTGLENANFFVANTQTNIVFADSIIISLDSALKNSYQQLFTLRRNPPPQTPENPSNTDAIRILEEKIFNLHRNKKEIISIKIELLNLKRTIISTTDARQLVDLSSQIPRLSSRLGSVASRAEAGINATPSTSTGSQKWDTVQEIQGSIDSISAGLSLIGTMAEEANRVASTTVALDRRSELERLSADLLNNKSRPLQDLRINLTSLKDRLTRALANENIQALSAEALVTLEGINIPLRNADDAIERAGIVLKQQ